MTKRSVVFAATVLFVLALASVAMAADPFVGTWKLNVTKSKVPDPSQVLKSCLVKVGARANGLSFSAECESPDGKVGHTKFNAQYDGKDYPVTEDPDCDTVALKKINSNTLEYLWKKEGKVQQTWRAIISHNGKEWIITSKGKNPKGENFTVVYASDKQ